MQHVVDGPRPIGELAQRLGVTQQAASKTVGELARLGYLERPTDPADARVRRVGLTARGADAPVRRVGLTARGASRIGGETRAGAAQ